MGFSQNPCKYRLKYRFGVPISTDLQRPDFWGKENHPPHMKILPLSNHTQHYPCQPTEEILISRQGRHYCNGYWLSGMKKIFIFLVGINIIGYTQGIAEQAKDYSSRLIKILDHRLPDNERNVLFEHLRGISESRLQVMETHFKLLKENLFKEVPSNDQNMDLFYKSVYLNLSLEDYCAQSEEFFSNCFSMEVLNSRCRLGILALTGGDADQVAKAKKTMDSFLDLQCKLMAEKIESLAIVYVDKLLCEKFFDTVVKLAQFKFKELHNYAAYKKFSVENKDVFLREHIFNQIKNIFTTMNDVYEADIKFGVIKTATESIFYSDTHGLVNKVEFAFKKKKIEELMEKLFEGNTFVLRAPNDLQTMQYRLIGLLYVQCENDGELFINNILDKYKTIKNDYNDNPKNYLKFGVGSE